MLGAPEWAQLALRKISPLLKGHTHPFPHPLAPGEFQGARDRHSLPEALSGQRLHRDYRSMSIRGMCGEEELARRELRAFIIPAFEELASNGDVVSPPLFCIPFPTPGWERRGAKPLRRASHVCPLKRSGHRLATPFWSGTRTIGVPLEKIVLVRRRLQQPDSEGEPYFFRGECETR